MSKETEFSTVAAFFLLKVALQAEIVGGWDIPPSPGRREVIPEAYHRKEAL